jgi:sec-independent protein translocase protein TatC
MLALAIPMCLLYELGLLLAPAFVRATQAPPGDDLTVTK